MTAAKQPEREQGTSIVGRLAKELAALTPEELRRLQTQIQRALRAKKRKLPSTIPVEIFASDLSPAEAIVKYLKEEYGLTFSDIAQLINRDQRGIWGSYARAQKKHPEPFIIKETECEIPLAPIKDRTRSILEQVVTYLKDVRGFTPSHICALLKKQPSTIWTVYQRGREKALKK